jgi:hypothetical protein
MRLNRILLVILMTLLFAGSATSATFDSLAYQEVSNYSLDLQESTEGDGDSLPDASAYITAEYPHNCPSIIGSTPCGSVQGWKSRLISYPLLPQAPPTKL